MRNIIEKIFKVILPFLCLSILLTKNCLSQSIPDGPYFGQEAPGLTPEVFAPGIISVNDRYEYTITFSPDDNECCFGITDASWSSCNLYYTQQDSNGVWSEITQAYFQGGYDGWLPYFAPDGEIFFFASTRPSWPPSNIWVCKKTSSGWGNPVKMDSPINTSAEEWRAVTTINKTLYFCSKRTESLGSSDIYKSTPSEGQYLTVMNLGPPVNTSSLESPTYVSHDEKYMLLESHRPGGYGQGDLYISYMKNDSSWTNPKNLGPAINTDQIEDGGYISPDGKYFFFNRRMSWFTNIDSEIHWVDSKVIFGPYVVNPVPDASGILNTEFTYTIPENTFTDFEEDDTIYVSLVNTDSLPSWLSFDTTSRTFTGIPTEIGITIIEVTAFDPDTILAKDTFKISVFDYFGQTSPGKIPEVFAPGVISIENRNDRALAISPFGDEMYFTEANWPNSKIYQTKFENNAWTEPEIAEFSQDDGCTEPSFSPNGQSLFFSSNRQSSNNNNYQLWKIEKNETGWSEPVKLSDSINLFSVYHPCIVNNKNIYFVANGEIYISKYYQGSYMKANKLHNPVNTSYRDLDAYINPEETYMIFKSNRPGGFGGMDLYISYRKEDNTWTNPKNLGSNFNTNGEDDVGDISPDGKYMFFTRYGDIYWVSRYFIDSLKYTNYIPYIKNNIPDTIIPENLLFTYTLPDSIFFDDDGNSTLSYLAKLSNEEDLPDWLDFNERTRTFSGTPVEDQELNIKVTATDTANESVSETFKITVESTTGIMKRIEDKIKIYPNPFNSETKIQYQIPDPRLVSLKVYDMYGRVISTLVNEFQKAGTYSVFFKSEKLPNGVYLLKLKLDNSIVETKEMIIIK